MGALQIIKEAGIVDGGCRLVGKGDSQLGMALLQTQDRHLGADLVILDGLEDLQHHDLTGGGLEAGVQLSQGGVACLQQDRHVVLQGTGLIGRGSGGTATEVGGQQNAGDGDQQEDDGEEHQRDRRRDVHRHPETDPPVDDRDHPDHADHEDGGTERLGNHAPEQVGDRGHVAVDPLDQLAGGVTAVELVIEAEDYNFGAGQFLADPQPSGMLEDGETIIASPHKVYGPESNDLSLQLRKRGIDKVVLGGMSANLCVESHLRELLEQVPQSVLAIMRVPGLGPKKAAAGV